MTEIVFIIDQSGSMHGMEADTIGGFNSTIEKQRKSDEPAYVSTVLFSDYSKVIHDRIPLAEVPQLTDKEYCPGGCTALLDAIGGAIHHIGNVHKYARKEDVPQKTLFVIITDGLENVSHKYSYSQVREMIQRQKSRYDWEFLFLGANIDAVVEAGRLGIERNRAANFILDEEGSAKTFEAIGNVMQCCMSLGAVSDGWAKTLDEDVRKRGKK